MKWSRSESGGNGDEVVVRVVVMLLRCAGGDRGEIWREEKEATVGGQGRQQYR